MQGVSKIVVSKKSVIAHIDGTYDEPFLVTIKDIGQGGVLFTEVPDDGWFPGTPIKSKTKVKWITSFIEQGKGISFTEKDACGLIGHKIYVTLSKQKCGSGLQWIEAFIYNPENQHPTGFYLRGECEPKIISGKWRKYSNKNNGDELEEHKVRFGDILQFHLETEGLNGDMLEVTFRGDEEDRNKEGDYIVAKVVDQVYNGKLIINFPINMSWRTRYFGFWEKFSSLKITPEVACPTKKGGLNLLKDVKPLIVNNSISEKTTYKSDPVPVTVGKIATDPKKYNPCTYTSIVLKTDQRHYTFFNVVGDKSDQNKPFQVVAGESKGRVDVVVEVKGLTTHPTVLCSAENHHDKHLFGINGIPKYLKSEDEVSDMTTGFGLNLPFPNSYSLKKTSKSSSQENFEIVKNEGNTLKVKVGYKYDHTPVTTILPYIFRYFWIPSAEAQEIEIPVNTCRIQKKVVIEVLPDVEWELHLGFNMEREKIPLKGPVGKNEWLVIDMPVPKFLRKIISKDSIKNRYGNYEVEMSFSLKAGWNGGDKLDLKLEFEQKIKESLQALSAVGQYICKLFEGKEDQDSGESAKATDEHKKTLRKIKEEIKQGKANKDYAGIKKTVDSNSSFLDKVNVVRKPLKFEVIWPSLGIAAKWHYAETNTKRGAEKGLLSQAGVVLEMELSAEPIIGMKATLDFLALVQRAHPLALAAITVADISLALIGDGSEMNFNLSASGSLFASVNGFINTLTGDNTFNASPLKLEIDDADKDTKQPEYKVAKFGGELKIAIEANVRIQKGMEIKVLKVKVVGKGEFGLKAEAAVSGGLELLNNHKGFFLRPIVTFEGLELSGYARVFFKVSRENAKGSSDYKTGVGGEFKYVVFKKRTEKLDPIYFSS